MATQAHWEFLIQQEGDRAWLPLDSPEMEILEGRYRMIARSSRYNADLEVRMTHEAHLADQPKRRTQKRSARTNGEGFLLVLPFTMMQPGTWQFRCSGDVMTDLLGESWQESVLLKVLPKELDDAGDWDPDFSEPTPDPVVVDLTALLETPPTEVTAPVAADLPLAGPIDERQEKAAQAMNQLASLDDLFGDASESALYPVITPEEPDSALTRSRDDWESLAPEADEVPTHLTPIEEDTELNLDLGLSAFDLAGPDTEMNTELVVDPLLESPRTEMELVTNNDDTLLDLNAIDLGESLPTELPEVVQEDDMSVFEALFDTNTGESNQGQEDLLDHPIGADLSIDEQAATQAELEALLNADDLVDVDLSAVGLSEVDLPDVGLPELDLPLEMSDEDFVAKHLGHGHGDELDELELSRAALVEDIQAIDALDADIADVSDDDEVLEFNDDDALSMTPDLDSPLDLGFDESGFDEPGFNEPDFDEPMLALDDLGLDELSLDAALEIPFSPLGESETVLPPLGESETVLPPLGESETVLPPLGESVEPEPIVEPSQPEMLPGVWGMTTRTGAVAAAKNLVPAPIEPEPIAAVEPEPIVEPTVEPVAEPTVEPIAESIAEPEPVELPELIDPAPETPAPETPLVPTALPELTIDLQPNMYTFRRGQALIVHGQVIPAQIPAVIDQGELVIKLIDPQSAQAVAEFRQPLQRQNFPFAFSAPLTLQTSLTAQLLVGEVTIWNDGVEELAQQTFTAMADMADLLGAIDPNLDPASFETTVQPPTEPENPLPAVDFSFFDYIGAAPEDAPEPAPLTKRETMEDVDLPNFWAENEVDLPGDGLTADGLTAIDDELFSADSLDLESMSAGLFGETPESADLSDDALDQNELDALLDESPRDAGSFEPGDAIADDLLLTNLVQELPPELVAAELPEPVLEPELEPEPEPIPMPLDGVIAEIVVDDLPEVAPKPKQVSANPLLLDETEVVPEPVIVLETGELVTGQALRVKVKLPNILPKLYVKLWINDRQTRTLLDGPRWLVDFAPNGRNELEATTQLTVPFGSLEIQIAAITVEAATKRESYRAVVDRAVIPPNLDDDLSVLDVEL